MPTFTNPKDLERYLKRAADALQAEVIITTQAELGSTDISPFDTGRFRSSWFAAESTPSTEVAPEGTDSPNTDATDLRVDSSKTYYLSNNLVYAESVAVEGRVVSQPPTWFKDFRSSRIPKIQQVAARVVKRAYDL